VAKKNFRECTGSIAGRKVQYTLADQGVQLTGRVRLRQVTLLTEADTRLRSSRRAATCPQWRLPTACSSVGDKKISLSTCGKSSP